MNICELFDRMSLSKQQMFLKTLDCRYEVFKSSYIGELQYDDGFKFAEEHYRK